MKLVNAPCNIITPVTVPISVHLPDKSTMRNTHEGYLTLPNLPSKACKKVLFDDIQSSVVSIGQLCDAGWTATSTKEKVLIKKTAN